MKNGEFLKKVNQYNEIEKSEFAKKFHSIKKRDAIEISNLLFLPEEKILISASQDSTIRIYDEADPEESVLLKVLCGANQNTEITVLVYSNFYTLLASGSSNGHVAIWDLETNKLDGLLVNEYSNSEVIGIEFMDPLPLLVCG